MGSIKRRKGQSYEVDVHGSTSSSDFEYSSDEESDSNIVTVRLRDDATASILRRATTDLNARLRLPTQHLEIIASTLQSDQLEEPNVRLITKSNLSRVLSEDTEETATNYNRWIHYQTDSIRLANFERIASNATLTYHRDLHTVVVKLLHEIRDKYEHRSAYGSYIEPGTVLRCDGTDPKDREKPDLSAIFISYPYFDVGIWEPAEPPTDDMTLLTRGLYQHHYPHELTSDADRRQMFRKFKGVAADQYLCIPQVWALVLQSETIISCGPAQLRKTFDTHFEFINEGSFLSVRPSLVQVADLIKQVTYLPIDECLTFIGLKQSIESKCLAEAMYYVWDCRLHIGHRQEELSAIEWPGLLQSKGIVFIPIRLSRKPSLESRSTSNGSLEIKGPEATLLIEYGGLSSGESDEDNEAKASSISTADSTIERLEAQGLVVNDLNSLEDATELSRGKKPKVYMRSGKVGHPSPKQSKALIVRGTQQSTEIVDRAKKEAEFIESLVVNGVPPRPEVSNDAFSQASTSESEASDHKLEAGFTKSGKRESQGSIFRSTENPSMDKTDEEHASCEDEQPTQSEGKDVKRETDGTTTSDSSIQSGNNLQPIIERENTKTTGIVSETKINETIESQSINIRQDDHLDKSTADSVQPTLLDRSNPAENVDKDSCSGKNSPLQAQASASQTQTDKATTETKPSAQLPEAQVHDQSEGIHSTQNGSGPPAENDMRSMIREEIQAAFQDHDYTANQIMRMKLTFFGFTPEHIESMTRQDKLPKFFRFKKDHFDIDVLRRYGIPWEVDEKNPDYIILLKELKIDDIDALTKHTQTKRQIQDEKKGQLKYHVIDYGAQSSGPSRAAQDAQVAAATYVKVLKDHVAIDTLQYFDIPWEYDKNDPKYVVILREMDNREVNILFEHTRSLRTRGTQPPRPPPPPPPPPPGISALHTDGHQPPPPPPPRIEKFPAPPAPPPEFRKLKRDSYHIVPSEPPHVNSKIPPFLAWPTTPKQNQENSVDHKATALTWNSNKIQSLLIQAILADIEEGIRAPKGKIDDLPAGPNHPFKVAYKEKRAFLGKSKRTLRGFGDKIGQLTSWTVQNFSPAPSSARTLHRWQVSKLGKDIDEFSRHAQQLIDQFVPKHYTHSLLESCWDSLSTLSTILETTSLESEELSKTGTDTESTTLYVIKDIEDKDYKRTNSLLEPDLPIIKCTTCEKSTQYLDTQDAMEHLLKVHFPVSNKRSPGKLEGNLIHWIASIKGAHIERRNDSLCTFIITVSTRVRKLLHKSADIRNGVANESDQKSDEYLLPSALVKAAEKIFQFLPTAMYCFRFVQIHYDSAEHSYPVSKEELDANVKLAVHYSIAADDALSKAYDELLLMSHTNTNPTTSTVHYTSICPETVILYGLAGLAGRLKSHDKDIIELYQEHFSTLRYEAGRKPSKQILRDLFLLSEEFKMIRAVIKAQHAALQALGNVLNNKSYRITSYTRINAFRNIESPLGRRLMRLDCDSDNKQRHLENEAAKTAQVLRHSIEIMEEGQSKAILVFTLVTIVFLPLSFVTSFFGMNVTDVRNMGHSQVVFWEAAIPLTVVIGGLSLIVAYKERLFGNVEAGRSREVGSGMKHQGLKLREKIKPRTFTKQVGKRFDEEAGDSDGDADAEKEVPKKGIRRSKSALDGFDPTVKRRRKEKMISRLKRR